jgi:hypothetical protein
VDLTLKMAELGWKPEGAPASRKKSFGVCN